MVFLSSELCRLANFYKCSLADNDWKEEATANFIHAVRKFFVCDNISGADRLSVSVFFHDRIRNTLQPQEFRRSVSVLLSLSDNRLW